MSDENNERKIMMMRWKNNASPATISINQVICQKRTKEKQRAEDSFNAFNIYDFY